jgi:signal transduction histidine kinase
VPFSGSPLRRVATARSREGTLLQSRSELLRAGLFLASIVAVSLMFVFAGMMVRRLSEQALGTSELLARLSAQVSFPGTRDPQIQTILSEVVAGIDFPIVITDERGLPRAWRQVGLDPVQVPDASLDSLAQGLPIAPVIRARVEKVRAEAAELDRRHPPIVMRRSQSQLVLGRLHYGDSPLLEQLRWMPYLTAGGLVLLIVLGMWGLTGIRRAERRTIWVGMALETAHQLGTPLSSMLGWIELLRSRMEPGEVEASVAIPRAELIETLDEMQRDVEQLTKVAQRFSHIGSAPRLERQDVVAVVRQAVEYMRRRLPRDESDVAIEERYADVPSLACNRELLEWSIENLLANAISALDKRPGRIEVSVTPRGEVGIEIAVKDNGRGMTATQQRRAFEPGYTTKPRGWGLGLALTRRVVEEYHGGRLAIRKSVPGEGTTVVVQLPG